MEKKQLQHIFSTPFQLQNWQKVLKSVFGVSRLNLQPRQIIIPKNDKADAAFELGNFNTADDRIIGIYQVNVKPDVWLERNKVGLRELLRNVYGHDVDGALVVFVQDEKWRLSFVSEIRTLNETGELVINKTEPKRYTYLLGNGEKTLTPVKRIAVLTDKPFTLEDIRNAFSVEALNEEFYKIVAEYFYGLVGAVAGKGKKMVSYDRQLRLPDVADEHVKTYQEFAVRLIGRAVFCWFLKVKKSNDGISLLPEHLLSTEAVKNNPNYYHTVLEKLFFQTLNTPMPERIKGLPEGSEQIPFLNGGLFEPQTEDYYKPNKVTGLSENINTLLIPDQWFFNFFEKLEQYNFTIDENSVVDIEVSVDPEMLGRIFENLLAEIDPESGDTARKATGSFYTPREIVDYMATESLVYYLHNKTGIAKDALEPIFKMDKDIDFDKAKSEQILEALDNLKILDPACGSGAFPMGILQKIVMALQKLDRKAEWWKARQINRIENVMLRKQVKEKLDAASIEYARKIGIIQNSLYGVDIQPIAAEISKLRCFLTLVVDENIDETKSNRGVEPLPNLEFKFITANTLLKLPDDSFFGGLYSHAEELNQLQQLRLDYLQSYGEQKQQIKEQFKALQHKIYKDEIKHKNTGVTRAYKISTWDPFGHDKVDWFDPNWMYGVDKFDIVIGNPPYVLLQNTSLSIEEQESLRKAYDSAQYKTDLYHLFIEIGIKLATPKLGILCYITPNTFLKNKHNDLLRKMIIKETHLVKVIRFNVPIFKNASVDNSITITENNKKSENEIISVIDVETDPFKIEDKEEKLVPQSSIEPQSYLFDFDTDGNEFVSILKKIPHLKNVGRAYFGIQTFDRKKYVSDSKENNNYFPVVDGGNVHRYFLKKNTEFVLFSPEAIKSGGNNEVYQKERILVRQIGKYPEGCYCPPGIYTLNTIYNIYVTVEDIYLKYLLAIINSKLIQAYWLKTSFDNKESFPKIKKDPIESLPIIKPSLKCQQIFINLVDSILFIFSLKDSEVINEYVPNSHIVQLFEEVIDALVYELYFEEDFKNAKIAFLKYAERDFKNIDGLSKEEKIKSIHGAYQELRKKENEIRQNLKLMDTRLADLIMPIKTAK
ncbi:Eco57I restriction-modification methylase domain-containing protein [Chitinophaga ginsengisegetis]|uniref:Eco57I restriction-modification methylase domain-containing protein n=1 Tax=Chitinophaga ginsengisegetis TaxID=393003 RepID=UPI000DB920EA|nr:TaqI-like C-terminal specificity domain-containing protein [Chitinophaga ginsengisegetis]MDR6571034.1 hypothetical protein [Chitinophaga ginsengisegetis]MDR6650768.1 hypothetical protein [Chitinophaga ginsengisegetis]MDR6657118.1 hypothetical protein [Chitinophaga ginsengisegetis]